MEEEILEQYDIDDNMHKWVKKTVHKRHPKWKKRRWLRVTLYVISAFSLLFLFNIIPAIVAYVYFRLLRSECRGKMNYQGLSSIVLRENDLHNLDYSLEGMRAGPDGKEEIKIPFESIRMIEWNEHYHRYEISGTIINTIYSNYSEKEILSQNISEGRLDLPYQIYWIYHDREKFSNSIEEKTGLKIINI